MYIDPREHRRRTWRIIGRAVRQELLYPLLLIAGIGAAAAFGAWLWRLHPLALVIPVAMVLLGLIGAFVWDWARNKAMTELKQEQRTDKNLEAWKGWGKD